MHCLILYYSCKLKYMQTWFHSEANIFHTNGKIRANGRTVEGKQTATLSSPDEIYLRWKLKQMVTSDIVLISVMHSFSMHRKQRSPESNSIRTNKNNTMPIVHCVMLIVSSPCSLAQPCKLSSFLPGLNHSCCQAYKTHSEYSCEMWRVCHANGNLIEIWTIKFLQDFF